MFTPCVGIAAAAIFGQKLENPIQDQLRVVFDLDSVLFSDEAERMYKEKGLDAFLRNELTLANEPLKEVDINVAISCLSGITLNKIVKDIGFESHQESGHFVSLGKMPDVVLYKVVKLEKVAGSGLNLADHTS